MRHAGDAEEEEKPPLILTLSHEGFAQMGLGTGLLRLSPSCIAASHRRAQPQLHPKRPTGHSGSFLYLTLPDPRIEEPLPHSLPATAKKLWSRFCSSCPAGLACRCSNHTRLRPARPVADGHS